MVINYSRANRLVDVYFRIAPQRFHYLKFILEGYDNLAVISSVAGHPGIVRLKCAEESLAELFTVLSDCAPTLKGERLF